MQDISFIDISHIYESIKDQIQTIPIQKILEKFKFKFLSLDIFNENDANINDTKQKELGNYLLEYLQNYKFLIYHYPNLQKNSRKLLFNESDQNTINIFADVVICVENECLIIQNENLSCINKIIEQLKEQQETYILNASSNINKFSHSQMEKELNEEINNFIKYFKKSESLNLNFINIAIRSLIGYLIRRYFCPTEYFKDPTFFTFSNKNSKFNEFQSNVQNLLKNSLDDEIKLKCQKLYEIFIETVTENINNEIEKNEFQIEDFIILRQICTSNDKTSYFYLVIHLDTFYIFVMKKYDNKYEETREREHEIFFCKNFSHRCITHFYGFLKNKEEILGLILEFMSNGTLQKYMTSTFKNNRKSLIFINRIFQGIDYLHSKKLIHRDIKPLNILIDHDNLPYVSDFDTIRCTDSSDEDFTNNLGSAYYTSLEQCEGVNVSYPTDIYSFGLLIYFICNTRYMISNIGRFERIKYGDKIHLKSKLSEKIDLLYENCVKVDQLKRPTKDEIRSVIADEMNSNDLKKYETDLKTTEIIQFMYENIMIQNNQKDMKKCFENIF